MGKMRRAYQVLVSKSEEKSHLEMWRIILKWVLEKLGRSVWTGYIWLWIGTVVNIIMNLWVQ
jgi:hypothetical protein